jgi:hypothetical protein
MPIPRVRATAWLAAVLLLTQTSSLLAAATPSRTVSDAVVTRGLLDRSVLSAADQQKVEQSLTALGYPADRLKTALTLLTPTDVHQLALNIRQLQPAGATRRQVVLAVVGVIVVILVVLVVTSKPTVNLIGY